MVKITDVAPRSRAEKAGIQGGDVLVSINGRDINDVLDYRFYLAEKKVALTINRNGETSIDMKWGYISQNENSLKNRKAWR